MIALNTTAVAWVLFLVILIGWVTYFFLNKGSAAAELGSEVEMAARSEGRRALCPGKTVEFGDDAIRGDY